MRPTLKEQLDLAGLSDEELIKLLVPSGSMEFWLYNHLPSLWHIILWKWFDIYEGMENADTHRCWIMKIKVRLFQLGGVK